MSDKLFRIIKGTVISGRVMRRLFTLMRTAGRCTVAHNKQRHDRQVMPFATISIYWLSPVLFARILSDENQSLRGIPFASAVMLLPHRIIMPSISPQISLITAPAPQVRRVMRSCATAFPV